MSRPPRRRTAALSAAAALLVTLLLGVTGCSTSRNVLHAEMELDSNSSELAKVGPDDSLTYGWNHLVGTTQTDLGPFEVTLLGNVDYERGSGPFFGFLTLTAPDGDRIAMRIDGSATLRADGVTELSSRVVVIGGSGAFVDASGSGGFVGERIAMLGAPIEIALTVDLENH